MRGPFLGQFIGLVLRDVACAGYQLLRSGRGVSGKRTGLRDDMRPDLFRTFFSGLRGRSSRETGQSGVAVKQSSLVRVSEIDRVKLWLDSDMPLIPGVVEFQLLA
jgi:hypothetical protein